MDPEPTYLPNLLSPCYMSSLELCISCITTTSLVYKQCNVHQLFIDKLQHYKITK